MPVSTGGPPAQRRRGTGWLRLLATLAVMVTLGAAFWLVWQNERERRLMQDGAIGRLTRELHALGADNARLDNRATDLGTVNQRLAAQIAGFGQRIEQHEQTMGRLTEDLEAGGPRLQLAGVEQLLLLANERLQLARDVRSAVAALEAADERLGRLADPRLFGVRKAISDERAELMAVPQPDRAAAALTLSSLIARAPRLPLAARVPDRFEAQPHTQAAAPAGAGLWERTRASVREALKAMFTVRRASGPAPRLLSEESASLVQQVLALKLEGTRAAWLSGDTVSFRDLCSSSAQWLRDYFRADDPGVLAALAELERLRPLELDPPLPDLTGSLTLLRAVLDTKTQ
ncbi:MAG TPA: uroporphyrinogen-III C-methyltransferase [Solimonas sp.]|nr:uroporphyrinogen-III C-methyltransferase [Solimonas sp.]